jgi:sirohydrochlorin cobaltochelatase
MTMTVEDRRALEALEVRLRAILPEEYQDAYEDVQPVSMGSAGLKYGADGKVAWNEIWATFCDLAMAGGPPHRGTLLDPGSRRAIEAQPEGYRQVVEEISRGVGLVTGLVVQASPIPGWVRVTCLSEAMAGWLLRAIVMENVSARSDGPSLDLPAGPEYRLEKEIKNVVTVTAKTCHYWTGHMWRAQQRFIGDLFARMAKDSPLVEPALASDHAQTAEHQATVARMAETIRRDTGLDVTDRRHPGWIGLGCPSVRAAVWMMRMLVASNVLSRREGTTLFVPINPAIDPDGDAVVTSIARIRAFASARGILQPPGAGQPPALAS